MNEHDTCNSKISQKRSREALGENDALSLKKHSDSKNNEESNAGNGKMRKVQEMREKAKLQLQQLSAADPEVGKDKSGKAKIWGRKHYGGIIISDETPTTIFDDDETGVDPGGPIREMLVQDPEYINASRTIAKSTEGYRGALFDHSKGIHFGVTESRFSEISTNNKDEKRKQAENHLRAIFGDNVDASEFLGVEPKSHLTDLPTGIKIPPKRTLFVDKLKKEMSAKQTTTNTLSNDSLSELKKNKFAQLRAKRRQTKE